MTDIKLTHIVCTDANGIIGKDNSMPWRCKADMEYFKEVTMGHCLIMGRKTYESLPVPLVGRQIVVVTKDPSYALPALRGDRVDICHSIDDAIDTAKRIAMQEWNGRVFIAGGSEIYRQTEDLVDGIFKSTLSIAVDGDASYPVDVKNTEVWKRTLFSLTESAAPTEGKVTYTYYSRK